VLLNKEADRTLPHSSPSVHRALTHQGRKKPECLLLSAQVSTILQIYMTT